MQICSSCFVSENKFCYLREKSLEQEHELMKKKIVALNDDLNKTSAELIVLRRNHAAEDASIQSQLAFKTEEVR